MKESSRWENSKSLIRLVNSLLYTPFALQKDIKSGVISSKQWFVPTMTFAVNFNESQKILNNLEYW